MALTKNLEKLSTKIKIAMARRDSGAKRYLVPLGSNFKEVLRGKKAPTLYRAKTYAKLFGIPLRDMIRHILQHELDEVELPYRVEVSPRAHVLECTAGQFLAVNRATRGLSRRIVAEMMGVSEVRLTKMEGGYLSPITIRNYSNSIGIDPRQGIEILFTDRIWNKTGSLFKIRLKHAKSSCESV